MEKSRAFYKLSLTTLLAVYFLILVGGIVRSTGSGMGCPDWPKCFGRWVPPSTASELPSDYKEVYSQYRAKKNIRFARYLKVVGLSETADKILADKAILAEADFNPTKTWVEYVNRLVGVVIGLLITATFVFSLRYRKSLPSVTFVALLAFLMVVFQGWIGSFVVSTNLTPWTITIHMFLALLIVALLIWLVYRSADSQKPINARPSRWLLVACMIVLLLQVLLGTQVREAIDRVAVLALREEWISEIGADLFIHRSFSWVVLILNGALVWNLSKTTGAKTFAIALILLILGTILTGVGMAYFGVPPFLQPVHLLLATVTFGMQFLLFLKLNTNEKTQLSIR